MKRRDFLKAAALIPATAINIDIDIPVVAVEKAGESTVEYQIIPFQLVDLNYSFQLPEIWVETKWADWYEHLTGKKWSNDITQIRCSFDHVDNQDPEWLEKFQKLTKHIPYLPDSFRLTGIDFL